MCWRDEWVGKEGYGLMVDNSSLGFCIGDCPRVFPR
jgi:hypothetical protein